MSDWQVEWEQPGPITLARVAEWKREAERLLAETMEGPYSVIVTLCDHILAPPPAVRVTKAMIEALRQLAMDLGDKAHRYAEPEWNMRQSAEKCRWQSEILLEAIAALAVSFPIQQDWQPIASAPKDQANKLLFGPTGVSARPTYIIVGHWYKTSWLWGLPAPDIYEEPTHWMPLPAPPGSQDADDIGQQEPGVRK